MLFRTPEDTYRAYQRFAEKGNFRKAYHCLESLLHQFPGDVELMVEIANLSLFDWGRYEMAKPWLIRLTRSRSFWADYALLSRGEVELGNNRQAREYLNRAKDLLPKQSSPQDQKKSREIFSYIETRLRYNEWRAVTEKRGKKVPTAEREKPASPRKARPVRDTDIQERALAEPALTPPSTQTKQEGLTSEREKESYTTPSLKIPVTISPPDPATSPTNSPGFLSSLKEVKLLIEYTHLTIQGGFDELLCLHSIRDVERFWYQIEAVKKVLKYFRGRVLLCDEVGLRKTIEAGMVIKEYLLQYTVAYFF